jgi:catechol 2,3-dioxygenase-like lactoylglutathione lyase family enzyme
MEPRISLLTLGVEDLERSLAFYRDGLGLLTEGIEQDVVFFRLQGIWLSLYSIASLTDDVGLGPRTGGFAGITIAHNVRTREEVDRLLEQAQQAGATIACPAREMHWGGYVGFFADPDGHVWEIAWNPHFWIE